jgi:hypothetical protein
MYTRLRILATKEANGISATVRRLIARALATLDAE